MAKKKKNHAPEWASWAISEVSFFAAIYYILSVITIQGSVLIGTLILFVLINLSVLTCPLIHYRNCCTK